MRTVPLKRAPAKAYVCSTSERRPVRCTGRTACIRGPVCSVYPSKAEDDERSVIAKATEVDLDHN